MKQISIESKLGKFLNMMKTKQFLFIILAFIILSRVAFGIMVFVRQDQTPLSYPRFDGWECLNAPPYPKDKTWQINVPSSYRPDQPIEIGLRNKYGLPDEKYSVQIRVIDPLGNNFQKSFTLSGDKGSHVNFPNDFTESKLIPGLYTYTFETDSKSILCSGFFVTGPNYTPRSSSDKHPFLLEASQYGLQYLPNFDVSTPCDTITIAGKIHGFAIQDSGINGLKVQLNRDNINLSEITRDNSKYGSGSYEFILPKQTSGTTYYLSVFDMNIFKLNNNDQLSAITPIIVQASCKENLIWANFEQVRLP